MVQVVRIICRRGKSFAGGFHGNPRLARIGQHARAGVERGRRSGHRDRLRGNQAGWGGHVQFIQPRRRRGRKWPAPARNHAGWYIRGARYRLAGDRVETASPLACGLAGNLRSPQDQPPGAIATTPRGAAAQSGDRNCYQMDENEPPVHRLVPAEFDSDLLPVGSS